MVKKSITIIGLGRLGNAFNKCFSQLGYMVNTYAREDEIIELNDLIFITTSDSAIKEVVEILSRRKLNDKIILHCSGVESLSVFNLLDQAGAEVGCFHPNQAITEGFHSFEGTVFDIVGNEKVVSVLEDISKELRAEAITIAEDQKQYLHIAAVVSSNYLVTLMYSAQKIAGISGLSEEVIKQAMLPLMGSVIRNLTKKTPSDALTGPIARGDSETLLHHVKLLKNDKNMLKIYRELGKITVEMMESEGKIINQSDLKNIFDD